MPEHSIDIRMYIARYCVIESGHDEVVRVYSNTPQQRVRRHIEPRIVTAEDVASRKKQDKFWQHIAISQMTCNWAAVDNLETFRIMNPPAQALTIRAILCLATFYQLGKLIKRQRVQ